ncbi:N-acetyltransferase family protein [Comamonas sp. GB3 AK4-5]|uniref:GNAT family N-acetyltransferase n=1 Tax=Comamonas sp. GB3 AK4-5 TaxID=3231487 RepID=UPI00351F6FA0
MHTIRRLAPADMPAFRQLRLAALLDSPTAFSATVDSEQSLSNEQVLARMDGPSHSGVWGAWNAAQVLVGCVGLLHLPQAKLQHKAALYSVYVAPCARGLGLGRRMLKAVIAHTRVLTSLRQLTLGVTAGNMAALRLYQSLGFTEYGCEPSALCVEGRCHDEILMQLRLRD